MTPPLEISRFGMIAALLVFSTAGGRSEVAYPFELPAGIFGTLDVNTTQKRPFNNLLLALNCSWPEGQYGITGYNNPDAQKLIRDLKPTSLRWPHGVWANVYDWEVDGRRMYDDYQTQYRDPVEKHPGLKYGFDGFHALHDEMKFDVLFTWNINYDSPEKGVRRLIDRREKGFEMKWIELGNETFWKNQRSNAVSTVEKYIEVTKAHAAALRKAEPKVKLSVNVTWRDALTNPWNTPLMKETYYDAITLHHYVVPPESPEGLRTVLAARREMIEISELMRKGFPGRPIWLSEWGVYCGDNAISTLGTADTFLGIFDRPDLFEIAAYFQINAATELIRYDKATHTHTKTCYGAAVEIIRGVFENSEMYETSVRSHRIEDGLEAVSAEAVIKDGKVVVFAINKTNQSVPLALNFDGVAYLRGFTHKAFAFKEAGEFPIFGLNESPLADVAPGKNGILLPPLSLNCIDLATTP